MLEKRKILVVSDYFGNKTTTFIYNEVLGLSSHFDVKYLCLQRNNPEEFPFDQVIEIPFLENKLIKKLKWWLEIYDVKLSFCNVSYSQKILELIASFKPDLIHCHFGYEALRLYQNLDRKLFSDIPIVVSFRGHDASFHLKRASYVKEIKKMLDDKKVYPTFVCQFLKRNMENKGIKVLEHLILHSGTKTSFFKRAKPFPESNQKIFFQVAHFERRKGQQEALRAFQLLLAKFPKSAEAKLILAGGGPTLHECKKLAYDLGIHQYVDFPGWLNPSQIRDYLDNVHVFIHHSLTIDENTEGIPNALMEAMSMEVPVVSTFHAGISELVEHGKHGLLVKEGDIGSFANAMLEVSTWGRKPENRKQIEDSFSYESHMDNLLRFYQKVLIA